MGSNAGECAPSPVWVLSGRVPVKARALGFVSTLIFPSEKNQLRLILRSSLLRRETLPAQSSTGFLTQTLRLVFLG